MDVHVPKAITVALRVQGVDVLTAQEDRATTLPDAELLRRATALGRVLVSRDRDLLREARALQAAGTSFAGVIYAHQLRVSIGKCIEDLHLIAAALEPEEMRMRVEYLPL